MNAPTSWTARAWSCTVRLVVGDPAALAPAVADLRALLADVDAAASRFRTDSALSRANADAGRAVRIPDVLADLVHVALVAARDTDGAVDPTLGRSMAALGYDRDILDVRDRDADAAEPVAGGRWREVLLEHRSLTVPAGVALDLGATAKARTADRAAVGLADRYGTAVLVELGGDVAVAGERPGGWLLRVAEREGGDGEVVTVTRGGLATSTTTVRTWTQAGRARHHVVDPATGLPVDGPIRTATVHAATALAANVAGTAALVRGAGALSRLATDGLAARLVRADGQIVTTPGWPGHRAAPPLGGGRGPSSVARPGRSVTLHRRADA